jgi:hypothetical protein
MVTGLLDRPAGLAFLHEVVGMAVHEPPSVALRPENLRNAQFHDGYWLELAQTHNAHRMSCGRPVRRDPDGNRTHVFVSGQRRAARHQHQETAEDERWCDLSKPD